MNELFTNNIKLDDLAFEVLNNVMLSKRFIWMENRAPGMGIAIPRKLLMKHKDTSENTFQLVFGYFDNSFALLYANAYLLQNKEMLLSIEKQLSPIMTKLYGSGAASKKSLTEQEIRTMAAQLSELGIKLYDTRGDISAKDLFSEKPKRKFQ